MTHTVLLATWQDSAKAYEAFSEIRNSLFDGINNVVVLERQSDGQIQLKDLQNNSIADGALGGGLIGSLVGILGGPLGVLLGFSSGALIGSFADMSSAATDDAVLTKISMSLPVDSVGLLIDFNEESESVADAYFADKNASVQRWSYEEVEAEIEASAEAWNQAQREAKRIIREQKHEDKKQERKQKWEEFKAKFD